MPRAPLQPRGPGAVTVFAPGPDPPRAANLDRPPRPRPADLLVLALGYALTLAPLAGALL